MSTSIRSSHSFITIQWTVPLLVLSLAGCSSESTNSPSTGGLAGMAGSAGQSSGGGSGGATGGSGGSTGGAAGAAGTAGAGGSSGATSCADQIQNGDETDVDCGGSCPACDSGQSCALGPDCQSGVCAGGVCKAPACDDGVKNAAESDVDCGGSVCAPCPQNKQCTAPTDCSTLICNGGVCSLACSSNTKNGNETDVDCGGSCPACADSKACLSGADCQSKVCDPTAKTCSAAACNDSVKNGSETDVDCGGACSTKCGPTQSCAVGSDCQSGVCTSGACIPATCADQVQNGDETDVDCGGSCLGCADTEKCASGSDCQSKVCDPTAKTCSAPTCGDSVQNGSETDVDCGGSCSQKCADTEKCSVNADCQSKVCDATAKTCSAPTCGDSVQNGSETDVDCGGSCQQCGDGQKCASGADCSSLVCDPSAKLCSTATCSDGQKNGSETDKDCGGSCPAKCGDGLGCSSGGDCTSGVCDSSAKTCSTPSCSDGVKNASETDVDCGGGTCPVCAWGKSCKADADCSAANGVCSAGKCWPIPIGVWEQRLPAHPPPMRYGATVAYDQNLKKVVLFGGDSSACSGTLRNDLWAWDGSDWSDVTPTTSPPARFGASLAFDEVAGELVLFGGGTGPTTFLEDTWGFSTASGWQSRAASGGGTRAWTGLTFHGSGSSGGLLRFGGTFYFDYFADTRSWSGSAWTDLSPSSPPTKRMGACFEYDSARNRTVMFGGTSNINAVTAESSETWEWDGSSWAKKSPTTSPPARYWASCAYDSVRQRTIVTFGMGSGHQHDTWEWDGTRWLRTLDPATWWKNSSFADTMVFDPARRRSVWFNDGYQSACANETYEYYSLGTPCASATDCAVGTSCTDGLCSKQASCGTCEATNTLGKPGECAPVLGADDPDTCTGTQTCNASGQCVSK